MIARLVIQLNSHIKKHKNLFTLDEREAKGEFLVLKEQQL